jgi:hypothetical protein
MISFYLLFNEFFWLNFDLGFKAIIDKIW